MKRRKAMEGYLALLTKISPNWRLASMLGNDKNRSVSQDSKAIRGQSWSLTFNLVSYTGTSKYDGLAASCKVEYSETLPCVWCKQEPFSQDECTQQQEFDAASRDRH